MMMKRAVQRLWGPLRLLAAAGILVFLVVRADVHGLAEVVRESLGEWPWLLAAAAVCFAGLSLGMARWKLILDANGLCVSWPRIFCVFYIGQFFNAFMFGSTGGDVARALYAAREMPQRKTEAVASVLIDRTIGLLVLNGISLALIVTRADFFIRHRVAHLPALVMIGMNAVALLGILALFHTDRIASLPLVRRVIRHATLGPLVRRTLASVLLYRRRTGILTATLFLSLGNHLLTVLQCYCLGRAFQMPLGFVGHLTVVPLIISLAALPITPGGLGIREGLAVALYGALAIPDTQALPLSLMIFVISLLWSLMGGLVFLGYTAGTGRDPQAALRQVREQASRTEADLGIPGAHE